jgi:hypothetical protein
MRDEERGWYCPYCGTTHLDSGLWEHNKQIQEIMEGNFVFWQAMREGRNMMEKDKKLLTEKQGEGQVDIDADISYFEKKIETARSRGDDGEVSKIERQKQLLEDSLVVYRLETPPRNQSAKKQTIGEINHRKKD